jgi:hypothetical protein
VLYDPLLLHLLDHTLLCVALDLGRFFLIRLLGGQFGHFWLFGRDFHSVADDLLLLLDTDELVEHLEVVCFAAGPAALGLLEVGRAAAGRDPNLLLFEGDWGGGFGFYLFLEVLVVVLHLN